MLLPVLTFRRYLLLGLMLASLIVLAVCDANYDCRLTTIGMAGST